MKKVTLKILLLSCLLLLSDSFSLSIQNPALNIGIVQHFGKEADDKVNIFATDSTDSLIVSCPKENLDLPVSENTTEHSVRSIQLTALDWEKKAKPYRIIASTYRTYEQTYYWANILKAKFPKNDWKIVYADPWQVMTEVSSEDKLTKLLNTLQDSGFQAKQAPQQIRQTLVWKEPNSHKGFECKEIIIKSRNASAIKVGRYIYPGSLHIKEDYLGTHTIINKVSLEEYLRGVVPFEIGADAATAALQVQAILARTYVLANLHRFEADGYQLCATQHCQVYRGLSRTNSIIDLAIKQTAGLVLMDNQDKIAQVFYYSTDGGHSAAFSDVWPLEDHIDPSNLKNLKGVFTCHNLPHSFDLTLEEDAREFLVSPDSKTWGCNDHVSHHFRWTKQKTMTQLSKDMLKAKKRWKFNWPEFNRVLDLAVTERSQSGRVLALSVKTDKSSFKLSLDEMRAALGGLKSTFFIVDKMPDDIFLFRGAGFGHGVGLSQYGARYLAENGIGYSVILNRYFPNYKIDDVSKS